MEIDRETIKALSSDTRIEILKALSQRRYTISELSRKLGIAVPTVFEHIKKLENAELVVRKETGHKWIYYEITEKGRSIIKPKKPVYVILSLFIGVAFSVAGTFKLFRIAKSGAGEAALGERAMVAEEALKAQPKAPQAPQALQEHAIEAGKTIFGMSEKNFYTILVIVGIILILASMAYLMRKRSSGKNYLNI